MTVLAAPEIVGLEDLDLEPDCSWGRVVQPYLDECTNEPVWGVECPNCPNDSYDYSCAFHYDLTFRMPEVWECLICKVEWKPEQLNWFRLPS